MGVVLLVGSTVASGCLGAQTAERRNLTSSANNDRTPRWSPDGKRILFESDRDGDWEIYVMASDGTGVEQLTDNDAADRFPAWSPEGRRIVFQSDRAGGGIALYILEMESGEISTLMAAGGAETHPDWSPDGRWVAFTSTVENDLELFLVNVEFREIRRLTKSPYRDVWPRWSPDGGWILFFSRRDTAGEDDELYVIRPDGSDRRRITMPSISPDSTEIAYTARHDGGYDIYVEPLPEGPSSSWVEPGTGMEFSLIPAGEFVMGSPVDEPGHESQEVQHSVTISRPFYMARHEVTQAQWQSVMGSNPSLARDCGDDCPVENISWFEAREFISRLNRGSSWRFRLPTEAEWEYACRAGTDSAFHTGENLTTAQANYDGNYPLPGQPQGVNRESPTPVGSFPPNPFGLFDMHGNVWEWCEDWHCDYSEGSAVDPVGDCKTEYRVIRGGSWIFNADSARCALRYTHRPVDTGPSLGFRVVREVPDR